MKDKQASKKKQKKTGTKTESTTPVPEATPDQDNFNNASGSESYDNQEGNAHWSSDWVETGDDGDVASGDVQINGNNELRFDNDDASPPCVEREFSFTGTSANLIIEYFFDGDATSAYDATDVFSIQISDDDEEL